MEKVPAHQRADSLSVSALLTIAGGFLDAYTYLERGEVLANAQTGNMIFLMINLTQGHWKTALSYFIPILFFAAGIWIAEAIRFWKRAPSVLHWQQIILAIECLIILLVSFIPRGPLDMVVNIAVSLVCSMQVQSFRQVRGNPFASTMCTGNLRSGSESLFLYTRTSDKQYLRAALHYFAIIGLFILGAAAGAFSVHFLAEKATLVCCALLLPCLWLLRQRQRDATPTTRNPRQRDAASTTRNPR